MQGWICGRCNASVAPWAAMCPGCSPNAQPSPPGPHGTGQAAPAVTPLRGEPTPPYPLTGGAPPGTPQYEHPAPAGPPRFEPGSFPIGATAADPTTEVVLPKTGGGGKGGGDKASDVELDSSWLE